MAERNCMVDRRGTLEFSPWKRNETKTFERKRDVFVYGRSTEMRQKMSFSVIYCDFGVRP